MQDKLNVEKNEFHDAPIETKESLISRYPHIAKAKSIYGKILGAVEEPVEGGSISYSLYTVAVYDPSYEGKYGYGFVVGGFLGGALVEVLRDKKLISQHQHRNYQIVKESLAGAIVAGGFVQGFLPTNLGGVLIGSGVTVLLSGLKCTLEFSEKNKIFKSKPGKALQYSAGGLYSLMAGAGVAEAGLSICEGFGVSIPPYIQYSVTGALALGNLFADLPFNKKANADAENPFCYHPAWIYRTVLYSAEVGFFLTILLFDIITNIEKSTEIKDPVFYSVVAITAFQALLIMFNKFINDTEEEEYQSEQTHQLIVNDEEEGQEAEIATEISSAREKDYDDEKKSFVRDMMMCCANFWHKNNSEREPLLEEDESKEITNFVSEHSHLS